MKKVPKLIIAVSMGLMTAGVSFANFAFSYQCPAVKQVNLVLNNLVRVQIVPPNMLKFKSESDGRYYRVPAKWLEVTVSNLKFTKVGYKLIDKRSIITTCHYESNGNEIIADNSEPGYIPLRPLLNNNSLFKSQKTERGAVIYTCNADDPILCTIRMQPY